MSGVDLSELDLPSEDSLLVSDNSISNLDNADPQHARPVTEGGVAPSMLGNVDFADSLSGKKRARRKPEHPQRVLDNSDSRDEGGRLMSDAEDSTNVSRSSLPGYSRGGEDPSRKKARNDEDLPSTPPTDAGMRGAGSRPFSGPSSAGKSPPAFLAAAASAAVNAAIEKGTVARTIGFEPGASVPVPVPVPAVAPSPLPPAMQLSQQFSQTVEKPAASMAPSAPSAPVAAAAGSKGPKEKPAPAAPAPAGPAVEKDKGKPITAFFSTASGHRPAQSSAPVAINLASDVSQDSVEGAETEPIFSSRHRSATFGQPAKFSSLNGASWGAAGDSVSSATVAFPADAASELGKLRSQLEQAQTALKQVTAALSKANADNEVVREETARWKAEVDASRDAMTKLHGEHDAARRAAATNLIPILRDSAKRDAAAFRRAVAENQARIGRIVTNRSGTTMYEVWEDGDEYIQLAHEEEALKSKKAELERIRKEIAKRHKKLRGAGESTSKGRKKAKSADDSDDSDDDMPADGATPDWEGSSLLSDLHAANAALSKAQHPHTATPTSLSAPPLPLATKMDAMAELDLIEAEEGAISAINALKREEGVLAERRRALEAEKALFLLDLKRFRAEAMSKWKGNPVLGDPSRYMLLELLGKGGFSEVWRAMDLFEVKEVAVKVHQLASHWSEDKKRNYVKHALREYEIQRALVHPHVVRLYAVIEIDSDCFATVLEYCKGSDLEKLLKSQSLLPEREARSIIIQVLSSLRYLNGYSSPWMEADGSATAPSAAFAVTPMGPPPAKRKIIHYDLKPANILFDEYRNAKVTDFGLSKIIDECEHGGDLTSLELTSQGAGTYWYLPPECFQMGAAVRISNKVDVWSVGVIFYQMLYGKRPFGEGQTQEQMLQAGTLLQQAMAGPTFPSKPSVSAEAKTFIRRCLTSNVSARPDVMTLCEDPYLRMKLRSG